MHFSFRALSLVFRGRKEEKRIIEFVWRVLLLGGDPTTKREKKKNEKKEKKD